MWMKEKRSYAGVLLLALLLSSCAPGVSPTQTATSRSECKEEIEALIDRLTEVEAGDIGYMPGVTGTKFLPTDDEGDVGMLILGGPPPEESPALLELVRKGADSIPCLATHLDDERETGFVLGHPEDSFGIMAFAQEYDYNAKTTELPMTGLNSDENWEYLPWSPKGGQVYTVTVGDLCFVALGQIVNRRFDAVRYVPTAIVVINSPAHSPKLLQTTLLEWGSLTPEGHKAALMRDVYEPDHPRRRTGALERLSFYYPGAMKDIDAEYLDEE